MADASELSEREAFGRKMCDVPEYPDVWVQFKTTGYPFKLRRQWEALNSDQSILSEIILPRITEWNFVDIGGAPVGLSSDLSCLDDVDDSLVAWLIRAFFTFWRSDLYAPRKNLSGQ